MIRVLIADDHPIVRQGLKQILSEVEDIVVEDEAVNCTEVIRKVMGKKFDVIILDISMPGRGGIDVLRQIKESGEMVPVLMLSIFPEEHYALRALKAGASGYLTKTCEAQLLVKAIRKVAGGGKFVSEAITEKLLGWFGEGDEVKPHERLSDREYEVMKRIAMGMRVGEIAEEMMLSMKTVSTYRSRVLEKMHMKNNAEIIQYALKNKINF